MADLILMILDLLIKKYLEMTKEQLSMVSCINDKELFLSDSEDAYNLIDYLIFNVKDYNLIISILKRFPNLKNLNGLNNNFFIRKILEKTMSAIKSLNKIDILYYTRVIDYFINSN